MGYIKLFFGLATAALVVGSLLVNIFEKFLPSIVSQLFRYGKFAHVGANSPLVLEVPKSWFKHFYRVGILTFTYLLYVTTSVYIFQNEVPEVIVYLLNFICGSQRVSSCSPTHIYIASFLLTCQVYRRFYDTHFISVFGKNNLINLTHYVLGMVYYPAVAIALLSEAPQFVNQTIGSLQFDVTQILLKDICAIILFFWAWYHQHIITKILANLRKNKKGVVVTEGHLLPNGDWFLFLSSPHSSAEIIMYFSITILLWNNLTWWFVFIFVVANQIETILLSHWWYQKNFKKFPENRKALIPFLY